MSNIASVEGALQALRYHKINKSFIPDENVFDFIIETLEDYQQLKGKEMAKKPIQIENTGMFDCPRCNEVLPIGKKYPHCTWCGGLIDYDLREEKD